MQHNLQQQQHHQEEQESNVEMLNYPWLQFGV
jgi:hypothetical protein